jgi:predicted nucleic acid-binding protein
MIVLDTDVLIEIFDKHSKVGDGAFNTILGKGDSVATTAINFHEIMYCLLKFAKPTAEILQIPVLSYTKEDSRLSAQLELGSERAGRPVRRTDAMIAAACINNEADIFTFDLKHFQPLKAFGLKMIC